MNFQEDDKNDYFDHIDETQTPEVKPKEPKKPVLKPDDPKYWDEEESEFEHLHPRGMRRALWWVAIAGVVIGLLYAAYAYWLAPYAVDAVQYGYVEEIENRGLVFKSYEGVLLPYKNLMDTTRVYDGDFIFSTKDTKSAVMLRKMQYANRPVRVVYKKYHTVLPWRGDAKYIVVSVDSVDPRQILPPDRQPEGIY